MTRVIIIVAAIFSMQFFAYGQQTIEVHITGLKSTEGSVYIALYNSDKTYLEENYKEAIIKADTDKIVAVFENIPAGEYAISSFYDKNGNEKMDKNFMGIPTEKYAFSNNAKGWFGPASFEDAKFEVGDEVVVQVLKY